jgi:UDP-N-acetyl-alpha-D-muramoyl-L-alanyl-L-glutamate epimerase
VPFLASDPARNEQLGHLRESYPVFRVEGARVVVDGGAARLEFRFTCGEMVFAPSVELAGLRPDEAALAFAPTAQRLIRALAIVEAFSYWKAFCSPVIEVALPPADPAETAWWESFWPRAMGEFFYRNGIDFTAPGFLRISAPPGLAPAAEPAAPVPGSQADAPPLVMFSGGKDSLALTYAIRDSATEATDFFVYNPTEGQRNLAESLANGGRIIEVRRQVLPELLALNDSDRPNGHTPYSAYLALAALLVGYLRGNPMVLAGNSRSDDEPNVGSYLGMPVNHQWTKSHGFEAALSAYRDRWLPEAPLYSSPLRPLLELQIIRSLEPYMDAYLKTASCNKTKGLAGAASAPSAPGCSSQPVACSATTWPSARPGATCSPTPICPRCTRPWPVCPAPATNRSSAPVPRKKSARPSRPPASMAPTCPPSPRACAIPTSRPRGRSTWF